MIMSFLTIIRRWLPPQDRIIPLVHHFVLGSLMLTLFHVAGLYAGRLFAHDPNLMEQVSIIEDRLVIILFGIYALELVWRAGWQFVTVLLGDMRGKLWILA